MTENGQALKIIPLGGLGEIGLNMMVFEYQNRLLLIDCGLMFPEDDMLGVDIVIPDFSYLEGRGADIEALILTHGHEDHIGAVPYFLRHHQPLLVGSKVTLAFLQNSLEEHKLDGEVRTEVVNPRDVRQFGPFSVEFVNVNHSMVGGYGLGIATPAGLVVHSGDYKLDFSPLDGETTDLKKFAEFGERGVLLLMSDSTNIEREGYTASEREIGTEMETLFRHAPGRILITSFASNIHRIQQVFTLAQRFGRKVLLSGKSIADNVAIARKLGVLHVENRLLLQVHELPRMAKEKTVILCTGSQGEPMSVLARIAAGNHKHIKVLKGDTVVLSSKTIPGNERAITSVINELYRQGAEVVYEGISRIHTSGHAHREELKLLLQLTRPANFIPVHGEYRHLVQHAKLARSMGVTNTLVMENGDVAEVNGGPAEKISRIASGRVYVDGHGVGDVGNIVLTDRRILSEDGTITCAIAHRDGVIVSGPHFKSKGLVYEPDHKDLLDEARSVVLDTLAELKGDNGFDINTAKWEITRAIRRLFNKRIGRRPIVIPVIMEV
ncbi:MAG TPA: ribonuclease J [bacterium]|nr:ribonuclease J [bacterium]